MTPVHPALSRAALALAAGAALATLAIALAPGTYYDLTERPLLEWPAAAGLPPVTPARIVTDGLMALFVFLLGKEGWEALTHERALLSGPRAVLPVCAAAGAMAGAAATWAILSAAFETAEEAADAPGWTAVLGGEVVLSYLFARRLFGRGHPALQIVLFAGVVQTLAGLVIAGLLAPGGGAAQLAWLGLSAAAACAGWLYLTHPAERPAARETVRARAQRVWPWIPLAALSWAGVALSGLPPALGFLPLLPAMPQATRSFGLFAVAERLLHDPANRLARRIVPLLVVVMFLFGLTAGGLDAAALGPTTWVALGALWLGKTAGFLGGAWLARRGLGAPVLPGIAPRDLTLAAGLAGVAFTGPVLALPAALPGGAMTEAARLGFALSLLAGPAAVGLGGRRPRVLARGP